MNKKLQVFVSSTYTDLIEERQAAVEAILDAGHIPAGMELFKAGKSQMKTIKKWIDESDVYMLILGGRYGSIEKESGLSYTELEYKYALSKKMPIFAIVLEDSFLYTKAASYGKNCIFEKKNIKKYLSFKDSLMSLQIVAQANDINSIKTSIHSNLNSILLDTEYKLSGWVRYNTVPQKNNIEISLLDLTRDLQNELDSFKQKYLHIIEKYNILSNQYDDLKSEHKKLLINHKDVCNEKEILEKQYDDLLNNSSKIENAIKFFYLKKFLLHSNFFILNPNIEYTLKDLFLLIYPLSYYNIQKIDLLNLCKSDQETLINGFKSFFKYDLFEEYYSFDKPFNFKIKETGHQLYKIFMSN